MSLLGIDVGTTGCKASAFSLEGRVIASAYEEYDCRRPRAGWAELDTADVWAKIKRCVGSVAAQTEHDPIAALAVSSLGEAVVPVTENREIVEENGVPAGSPLNFDARGEEFLPRLGNLLDNRRLYAINGNTLGNHYSLTKLLWLKDHQPEVYGRTYKFLLWSGFVSYMLGADPVADYSLANRTLLFDLERRKWSDEILNLAGLDSGKLPGTAPSGTVIGAVSKAVTGELGLGRNVAIVTGAHDQCANALGCGVTREGRAMFGMGTYLCLCPPFAARRDPALMIERGLNTEHHAVPGLFVSFIYNHGGSMLKWFRDTFAASERRQAAATGRDIYAELIREVPQDPSSVVVLPHFAATGPPEFISDSSGVIAGLKLETTRGDILKGVLEGAIFYIRECIESLPATGIHVEDFRAVGGGSKSDTWLQIGADILGRPFTRPRITEAGALGAAILAGTATGAFSTLEDGVAAMVHLDRTFEPNPAVTEAYRDSFERYRQLWPTLRDWLRGPR